MIVGSSTLTVGSRVRLKPEAYATPIRGMPSRSWTGIIASISGATALCIHGPEACDCDWEDCYRCGGTWGAIRRRLRLCDLQREDRRLVRVLILRRIFPRRATMTDLRRAHAAALRGACEHPFLRNMSLRLAVRGYWADELKRRLGGHDEVVAVCDKRSHVILRFRSEPNGHRIYGSGAIAVATYDLLDHADTIGYWQEPRLVRLELKHPFPMCLTLSISKSMRRTGFLKRRAPLRRCNQQRRRQRFELAYGLRGEHVRAMTCLVLVG
jgi:hypothetical protein